ncbi:NAD-dependent epimerase/dehydratase family protein [Parasphingopyxis algicola]|uniref:NAD-dependent epimerase/dehydratase family protein n=1 Tax=Parasphingopyxis algicola TaxID=2026624 RepID=UPI0015A034A6|nr:NAD-dependent epimerase/dehydratase family protein [Parasphingopyxis algicola]QLC23985.1 NAD-dependent epimerase/dehydratase family protein [Parasphingopyxis algicola]
MKLMVTGGAGFVGSNLIARLNALGGYEVVVLDNEVLGSREAITDLDAAFIKGDIRDAEAVEAALDGVEAIVHLAADTRVIPSISDPKFNFDVNVGGSLVILEAMRRLGTEKIVSASTGGAIIGEADPPVYEGMVASPVSPYGASKLAVEGYCSAYSACYGIQAASLRFSNVYGPRSWHKGSVVALFIKQILRGETLTVYGDGEQTRDYVHARDLADGIAAALQSDASGPIQLGTGIGTPLNAIIAMLREISAKDFAVDYQPFRDGEIVHTWCDISHARATLGYDPQIAVREGLEESWRWFVDNRERLAL